jgi:hypothetical protein
MVGKRSDYISYMLRLWRANGDEAPGRDEEALWRASLEDAHTGERCGFASLDELFNFLRRRIGVVSVVNWVEGDDSES